MGPAPAPHAPGICEAKAQLESGYEVAEAAFDTARNAIQQKIGTSSKDKYLILACGRSSLVPPPARREGGCYTHSRTRMRNDPGSFPEPQTDLVRELPGVAVIATWSVKRATSCSLLTSARSGSL